VLRAIKRKSKTSLVKSRTIQFVLIVLLTFLGFLAPSEVDHKGIQNSTSVTNDNRFRVRSRWGDPPFNCTGKPHVVVVRPSRTLVQWCLSEVNAVEPQRRRTTTSL